MYQNQGILTSYKTVNSDNPKLNCRIRGLEKFSPTRLILDKDLKIKMNTFIVRSSEKYKTIVFHSSKNTKKLKKLKYKKIKSVYTDLNNNGNLDLKLIFKKIYEIGIHNILVESGRNLTNNILKDKLFNEFYLFKSSKKIFGKDKINIQNINKNLNITFKTGSRHDGQFKGITNYSINLLHQQIHKNEKFIDSLERIGATYSSNVTIEANEIALDITKKEKEYLKIKNKQLLLFYS